MNDEEIPTYLARIRDAGSTEDLLRLSRQFSELPECPGKTALRSQLCETLLRRLEELRGTSVYLRATERQ